MKVLDVMVCLAAMAAPGLSMKMSHLAERQDSSTPTPGGAPPSPSTSNRFPAANQVHAIITGTPTTESGASASSSAGDLGPGSGGGDVDCASLEAKHEYFLVQVAELQSQHIAVPAYLAGYASAAADTLETLGCSEGKSDASDGQSGK